MRKPDDPEQPLLRLGRDEIRHHLEALVRVDDLDDRRRGEEEEAYVGDLRELVF